MKLDLMIFDEPVFYIQGFSKVLLEQKIFHKISNFQVKTDFLNQFKEQPVDFVLLGNFQHSIQDTIELVEVVMNLNKKLKLIIIGSQNDLKTIRKFFELGISCYLEKDTSYEEFLNAISAVKSGNIYLCNSAKDRMVGYISHQNNSTQNNQENLTKRELEVMKLICEGHSSKVISEKLFISINTVESHRKKILMKLNVKNSVGIVKYAVENNMLE